MTKPTVSPGESTGARARRVVARHLGRLRRYEAGTRDGRDPEDLHRARVAIRRLRAALRVFAGTFPADLRTRLVGDLRRLGRLLGGVRDLDVQLERLEAHRERLGPPAEEGIEALRRLLASERERARARLSAGMDSRRYARPFEELDAWILATDEGDSADVLPELRRTHRRFRKAGRDAAERPGARTLHELRIRAKKLRYALEFLDGEAGGAGRAVVERLADLQEVLGAHQDAVVGARLARRALREGASRRAARGLEALVEEERRVASEAREGLLDRWRKLDDPAFRRDVERAIACAAPPPQKKKGDALEGVP